MKKLIGFFAVAVLVLGGARVLRAQISAGNNLQLGGAPGCNGVGCNQGEPPILTPEQQAAQDEATKAYQEASLKSYELTNAYSQLEKKQIAELSTAIAETLALPNNKKSAEILQAAYQGSKDIAFAFDKDGLTFCVMQGKQINKKSYPQFTDDYKWKVGHFLSLDQDSLRDRLKAHNFVLVQDSNASQQSQQGNVLYTNHALAPQQKDPNGPLWQLTDLSIPNDGQFNELAKYSYFVPLGTVPSRNFISAFYEAVSGTVKVNRNSAADAKFSRATTVPNPLNGSVTMPQ